MMNADLIFLFGKLEDEYKIVFRSKEKAYTHIGGKVLVNQQDYKRKYERYNKKQNKYWSITTS